MTMTDVVNLLVSLNVQPHATPDGVCFEWYFDHGCSHRNGRARFRVERGSGIAGRGDAWNVVELPGGVPLGPKVTTRAKLRQQVLAAIAEGPRPPDRVGFQTYARWHTCGLTSTVQWFQRALAAGKLGDDRRGGGR